MTYKVNMVPCGEAAWTTSSSFHLWNQLKKMAICLPAPLPIVAWAPATTGQWWCSEQCWCSVKWGIRNWLARSMSTPAWEQFPVCCVGDVSTVYEVIKLMNTIKLIQLNEWTLGMYYVCSLSPRNTIGLQNLKLNIFIPFTFHILLISV